MKLLLLTSPARSKVKTWVCQETSFIGSLLPPMDLCYIAAWVEKHGHTAHVEDLRLADDWRAALRARCQSFAPDVILTNLVTTSYLEDIEMLGAAKAAAPTATIAAFGTHAESLPDEVHADGVDAILVGDPELAAQHLLEGNDRGHRTVARSHAEPAILADLDALPMDGARFVDLDRYHAAHHAGASRFVPLMASRGCPYACTYCLYPTLFGSKARYRSAKSMVDELEVLQRDFGVSSVNYLDATFNLNRKRLLAFCEALTERQLDVRYACNARCDLLDEETVAALVRSGCRRVYLGVEDPTQFDATKKSLATEEVTRAFRIAKRGGLERVAFLMVFPEGAADEASYVRRMGQLVDELEPDAVQVNMSIPFPGTADFDARRGELVLDWALFDPAGERLPYASRLDLPAVKRRIYRHFLVHHPRRAWRIVADLPSSQKALLARRVVSHLVLARLASNKLRSA